MSRPPELSRKERILLRLQELNSGPKRSLGQNFLVSDLVIDRILFAVQAEPLTEIVEVGPGLGALTEDLLEVAAKKNCRMTLIELDRAFAETWRMRAARNAGDVREPVSMDRARGEDGALIKHIAEPPYVAGSLRIVEADALKLDWSTLNLQPKSLFVSNLPYQISSSIAIERSIQPAGITRMILMFQREVAQRISARASDEAYGLLTVIVQTFWETATVTDASPKDFHPQPNVASRVLVFRRRTEPDFGNGSAEGFLKFAKAGFAHRRKLLTKNLFAGFFIGAVNSDAKIDAAFAKLGLLATARAEELDPTTWVKLYRECAE